MNFIKLDTSNWRIPKLSAVILLVTSAGWATVKTGLFGLRREGEKKDLEPIVQITYVLSRCWPLFVCSNNN